MVLILTYVLFIISCARADQESQRRFDSTEDRMVPTHENRSEKKDTHNVPKDNYNYRSEIVNDVDPVKVLEEKEPPAITNIDPSDIEKPQDNDEPDGSLLTFNLHGEVETSIDNKFRLLLDSTDATVLCLQEIPGNGDSLDKISGKYPHQIVATNTTKKGKFEFWKRQKKTSVSIVSKNPIISSATKVIQRDPGGDEWNRHAVYAKILFDQNSVDIFCYHNTYNWHKDQSAAEEEGVKKFKDWVNEISNWSENDIIVLGDFNFVELDPYFQTNQVVNPSSIDQIRGSKNVRFFNHSVFLPEYSGQEISDHDAVETDFKIDTL